MGNVKDVFSDHKLTRISIGEYNKQRVYEYIVRNASPKQGIYPYEIVKNTNIHSKVTRQTVQNHLRELIKEEKIYKQKGKYFPNDWNLGAILAFASFMREDAVRFIDPYSVTHNYRIYQPQETPIDQLFKRTTGISVSDKYCKTNFVGKKLVREKYLFEYANRIAAFIVYIFLESMRPRHDGSTITDNIKKDMSRNLIFNSISIVDLFDRFCLFLNDMQILTNEIPVSLEIDKEVIDPIELDNKSFNKLSKIFRNVYPGIYEGIEKSWFSSRQHSDKIGSLIAKNKDCDHNWEQVYIYKYKKSFECIKCHTVSGAKVHSNFPKKNHYSRKKRRR